MVTGFCPLAGLSISDPTSGFMTREAVNYLQSEVLITLDNKFQKKFCICDEYVINLFVCIYEVRNGTLKKLLGSSFKIMLH
jgi:hypothetical protein